MRHNGRIYPPKLGNRDQEIVIENMKAEYKKLAMSGQRKEKKPANLTDKEFNGRKKVTEKST